MIRALVLSAAAAVAWRATRRHSLDVREADPVALLREAADASRAVVAIEAIDAPATWPLDPDLFRRALIGLLRHADRAVSDGAPAVVGLSREEDTLLIVVRDFGAGLPPGTEQRVLERGLMANTRTSRGALPEARRIVERHGGRIDATNHPDGGAVFTVRLPRL